MIGVEHELFVYLASGRPVCFEDSQRLFDALPGVSMRAHDPELGPHVGAVDLGGAIVKYEHAPHLFEIATRPCETLDELRAILNEVWRALAIAARQLDLELAHEPLARVPPTDPRVWPLLGRNRALVDARRATGISSDVENFSAVLAATQVHVTADLERLDDIMPPLYEALVDTTDREYRYVKRSIARRRWDLYARGSIGPLVGFPDLDTWTTAACAACPDRDNHAIKPRHELGTLEFRSAPAQPTVEAIVELAALRLAQTRAAPTQVPTRTFRALRTAWWAAMLG